MKSKHKIKKTTGPVNDSEKAKEERFKQGIRAAFPDFGEINFTYSSLKLKHEQPSSWENEGCWGYFMKESILINGQPISVGWLPHVRHMTDKQIDYMVADIIETVTFKEKEDD